MSYDLTYTQLPISIKQVEVRSISVRYFRIPDVGCEFQPIFWDHSFNA